MSEWREDLEESTKIFKETVYPQIKHWFDGGELVPVEAVTKTNMHEKLDRLSGIDFWYVNEEKGMAGLASRVQPNGKNWETFTVRRQRYSGSTTEFEKRKRQIENDWLYPKWTTQAYTDGFDLLGAASIPTDKLISHIDNGQEGFDYWINNTHNADFFVVPWDKFDGSVRTLYGSPGGDSATLESFV